jgi:hypothetical protein
MSYIWTDDPINVNQILQSSYITELRTRTNTELQRRGEPVIGLWTDMFLNTTIKNRISHINQLRVALDNMCDIHLPAACNNVDSAYDTSFEGSWHNNEKSSYLTVVKSGLYNEANSSYLLVNMSIDDDTHIGGCEAHDNNVNEAMCTVHDDNHDYDAWGGADSTDCPGHLWDYHTSRRYAEHDTTNSGVLTTVNTTNKFSQQSNE